VGGDRLTYREVELPEAQEGEFDDSAFLRMQARWPLGHLAYVFGMEREQLLQLYRLPEVRLQLDGSQPEPPLERLLPGAVA